MKKLLFSSVFYEFNSEITVHRFFCLYALIISAIILFLCNDIVVLLTDTKSSIT